MGIHERPPTIPRSQQLELLVATRDLQKWGNVYTDRVVNCDSFEAKEAEFHSVCTSTLSGKQSAGAATLSLLLGGAGGNLMVYNKQWVTAAVQSISVEQALAALSAFEKNASR